MNPHREQTVLPVLLHGHYSRRTPWWRLARARLTGRLRVVREHARLRLFGWCFRCRKSALADAGSGNVLVPTRTLWCPCRAATAARGGMPIGSDKVCARFEAVGRAAKGAGLTSAEILARFEVISAALACKVCGAVAGEPCDAGLHS